MADEANKTDAPPKKKLPIKTIGIVLGLAVVQGAGFFFFFKSTAGSSPKPAHGEEHPVIEAEPVKPPVGQAEVRLLKSFKVPNDKSGRMWIYDIDISVVVAANEKDKLEALAEERSGEIGDMIARIVRAASDQMLREDDLRILRNQIAEGLAEITSDKNLVQRVLIPRLVPIPS
jgi:flagellar basal body-associated protein FliL